MSGPKGGSYRVIDAAELARRERERARALAYVAHEELREARADAEEEMRRTDLDVELPQHPVWPGDDADTQSYLAHASKLGRTVTALRQAVSAARRERTTQQVRDALGATAVTARARGAGEVLKDIAAATDDGRQDGAAQRILGRLRDDVLPEDREEVDRALDRIEAAVTADDGQRWEVELRHAVESANRRASELDEEVDRARHLLADLRASGPQPASDLDAALTAVLARRARLTEALVAAVRTAVTEAETAMDAAFVTAAVTESLAELGYDIGPAFDSSLARDGFAHIRRRDPRWADHGVRVRLDREGGGLLFHVVRAGDVDASEERDVDLEEEWCADLPALLEGLSRQGVELRIRSRAAPGELPVVSVPRSELEAVGPAVPADGTDAATDDRREKRRRARRQPRERGR